MQPRSLLRTCGKIVAAVLALWVAVAFGSVLGLLATGLVFLALSGLVDWVWRRHASLQDVQNDLADRVRNPPP